jgi:hypothetical protein
MTKLFPSQVLAHGPSYNHEQHYKMLSALYAKVPYRDQASRRSHYQQLVSSALGSAYNENDEFSRAAQKAVLVCFAENLLYFLTFEPLGYKGATRDQILGEIRPAYQHIEHHLRNYDTRLESASNTLREFLSKFRNLPTDGTFKIPAVEAIPHAAQVLQTLFTQLLNNNDGAYPIFGATSATLRTNLYNVSGIPLEDERKNPRLLQIKDSDLSLTEIVRTYFANTPFEELLLQDVPFAIPEQAFFEGQWIVAPQGTGKTQMLQFQIAHLLPKVTAGEASIIVMDSQEQMIPTIAGLDLFAPGNALANRLVYVDANDVEYPIALSLFDLGMHREKLAPVDRERMLNSALETVMFMMDSLLGSDLTSKQTVVFRFIMQAIFAIPGATIYTLKDLLSKGGYEKYRYHIETLQGAPREFFETQFNSKQFESTKDEIVRRLYGILGIPAWERMFNNASSKLDLFAEMNAGKVILINTSRALLQAKGCEAFGRFFLALIAMAAQRRATLQGKKIPCYIFIDECYDYIGAGTSDSNFLNIIEQCRKQKISMTVAHQNLSQLSVRTIDTLQTVAIKAASSVTDRDASVLARGMRTTPSFLENQPRGHFGLYVRNTTAEAISVKIPFGFLEAFQRMSREDEQAVRYLQRTKYSSAVRDPTEEPQPPDMEESSQPAVGAQIRLNARPAEMEDWRLGGEKAFVIHATVPLTAAQAAKGATVDVQIKGEVFEITLPRGLKNGSKIRLPNAINGEDANLLIAITSPGDDDTHSRPSQDY